MKISTKGRYGLRAMVDIAKFAGEDNHISLNKIATRQQISENYLEQIIALLRKEELVESMRGAKGGYVLTKPASEITVGEVLRVLEGDLAPVSCVTETHHLCDVGRECEGCSTKGLWQQLYDSTKNIVDNVTLYDLVVETEEKI